MFRGILSFIILTILPQFLLGQNGNSLFNDSFVHEIRIENIDTNSFFLFTNKGVYSLGKITIDGNAIDSIGLTTKGNISWSHANNKKPLKIKLNKFVGGKKHDGIKEFYLHNAFQDPSLMREKLSYDICYQMGLHSLRSAFSRVYINNVYWGLYTLVEAKDELYKRDFDNAKSEVFKTLDLGSLCVFNQTIPYWQVDNGNPMPTWPRLQTLIDKLANTPLNEYLDSIPRYFNILDFFKYQAVNVYLLNADSFLDFNGNQLYLFDSIFENRFQIIPWDFNASFGLWNTNQYNPNSLPIIPPQIENKCPFNALSNNQTLKHTYLDAMCFLNYSICDTTVFNNKINQYYYQIQQAVYSDSRKELSNIQFDQAINYGYQQFNNENVPGLKTFISERWVKINNDLQSELHSCSLNANEIKTQPTILTFPNPVKDNMWLNLQKNGTMEMYNLNGSLILQLNVGAELTVVDISFLPSGIYYLRIILENETFFQKIIKE